MPSRYPDRRPRDGRHAAWRGPALLGLVLALLLAQGQGLLHRLAHGPQAGPNGAAQRLSTGSAVPAAASEPAHRHTTADARGHRQAPGSESCIGHRHDAPDGPVAALPAAAAAFDDHDEGSAECRLYDQLVHADVLPGLAVEAASAAPVGCLRAPAATVASRPPARHFEARGPPRSA